MNESALIAILHVISTVMRRSHRASNASTLNSLYTDTQRKDNSDVRATPLVSNHSILTAVVPLSKKNLM